MENAEQQCLVHCTLELRKCELSKLLFPLCPKSLLHCEILWWCNLASPGPVHLWHEFQPKVPVYVSLRQRMIPRTLPMRRNRIFNFSAMRALCMGRKKKEVWYNVLQVAFNFCVTHAFVIHRHEIMNFHCWIINHSLVYAVLIDILSNQPCLGNYLNILLLLSIW